jgi:hypothetical protein
MSATHSRIESDAGPGTAAQDGRRYLLFAGTQQPPNGGLSDLVDTFTCEAAARRAFREVRLRTASTTSWAQLAVVDGDAGIKPLCWFGIGAEPGRYRLAIDPPSIDPKVVSTGRPHVPNRATVLVTALVAVATTTIVLMFGSDGTPRPVNGPPAVSVPMEASR